MTRSIMALALMLVVLSPAAAEKVKSTSAKSADHGSKISGTDSEIVHTKCEDQGCRVRKLAATRRLIQLGGCNEVCRAKCDYQASCIAEWGPRNLVRLESLVTTMKGRIEKHSADKPQ